MKNIKALAIYTFFVLAFVLPVSFAAPRQEVTDKKNELMEKKAERETAKLERKEEREALTCSMITERIEAKNAKTKSFANLHDTRFSKLSTRLDNLLTKLDEEGIDAGDLPAHVTEFKSLYEAYKTSVDLYHSKLAELRESACDEDKTTFMSLLDELKAAHAAMVDAGKAAHDYFKNVIREDLKMIGYNINAKKTATDKMRGEDGVEETSEINPLN